MKTFGSILVAIFAFTIPVSAQTAKVIQLSPEDAAQAKSLDEQIKALSEKREAFQKSIKEKYLLTKSQKDGGVEYLYLNLFVSGTTSSGFFSICANNLNGTVTCPELTPAEKAKNEKEQKEYQAKRRWFLAGWGDGSYEYSDDYKFIVPKPPVFQSPRNSLGGCWNAAYLTPPKVKP